MVENRRQIIHVRLAGRLISKSIQTVLWSLQTDDLSCPECFRPRQCCSCESPLAVDPPWGEVSDEDASAVNPSNRRMCTDNPALTVRNRPRARRSSVQAPSPGSGKRKEQGISGPGAYWIVVHHARMPYCTSVVVLRQTRRFSICGNSRKKSTSQNHSPGYISYFGNGPSSN